MELKEFVTQTLVQIVEGVKDAQEQLKGTGAIVNPIVASRMKEDISLPEKVKTGVKTWQNVQLSIAVNIVESSGMKTGAGIVVSALKIGKSTDQLDTNTTTSRVDFSVPVAFPIMEE